MIESALGYKFRDHIRETVLYEDQIVEHLVTGHIAERRVFPPRMVNDEIAFEAVTKQLQIASSLAHPFLPAIYGSDTVDKHFLYVQQHLEGETLELTATRKNSTKPEDWALISTRLVDLMLDLQQNGIAFDRLSLRDIILSNRMLLISKRYPVGKTSEQAISESPYLQRLFESDTTGIYHCEGRFPTQACLVNIKQMLFKLASANKFDSVESAQEYQANRLKASGSTKQYSQFGLEHNIEDLLNRLHDPAHIQAIRSLEDLQKALKEFDSGKAAPIIQASATTSSSMLISKPDAKQKAPKTSGHIPFSNKTSSKSSDKNTIQTASEDKSMAGHELDDDAEEDRSYLYPGKGLSSADSDDDKKSSGRISSLDHLKDSPSKVNFKQRRQIEIPWAPIIAVLILLSIGIGIYIMIPIFVPSKNQAPTASLVFPNGNQIQVQEEILITAIESSDPDEDTLTYNWRLLGDVERTNYILNPTKDDNSEITLKFFREGTYTIEISVYDGRLRSEPVQRELTVISP